MNINQMAVSATLHCLTGCAVGEVLGMIIGELLGWSAVSTVALAVCLAFLFGYSFSLLPLLRGHVALGIALRLVLAADSLSILTMEIVDNAVMVFIPGAMGAGLTNPLFWVSMLVALFAAFWAAFPVNRYLLLRNQGHALLHKHHH